MNEVILGEQPSFSVISSGAECLLIDKNLYLKFLTEDLQKTLRVKVNSSCSCTFCVLARPAVTPLYIVFRILRHSRNCTRETPRCRPIYRYLLTGKHTKQLLSARQFNSTGNWSSWMGWLLCIGDKTEGRPVDRWESCETNNVSDRNAEKSTTSA